MEMLRRPVVDALYLTPLAFAENPCHRLVKNYKLVRNAVSDPITDALLAAVAFREQRVEFARRRDSGDRDQLRRYRYCFQGATALAGAPRGGEVLFPTVFRQELLEFTRFATGYLPILPKIGHRRRDVRKV